MSAPSGDRVADVVCTQDANSSIDASLALSQQPQFIAKHLFLSDQSASLSSCLERSGPQEVDHDVTKTHSRD